MATKNRGDRVVGMMLLLQMMMFLLLACTSQCEARALRRSRKNSLLNALYKLNFIRTVEPMQLPSAPPSKAPSRDGDAASLAAADGSSSPYCVNPPNAPL
uniref:Uncharacterized protein n=1 Tax=Oryza brachyantha TaxID=4533 RepID=J3M1B4_ORYBR